MDSLPLKGKIAIVTGASRGIGAGIALELAKRGAYVVITYTSQSSETKVSSLISAIKDLNNGSTAISAQADLRSSDSASQILATTLAAFPHSKISVLVNNAGCELAKPLSEITPADMSYVYDLNVRSPLLMLQAVLPHLRRPGRIINIGSVGARKGFKGLSLYCSSKAALEGLTRCWAAELGSKGHTVNCVNPGPTETDMVENIDPEIVSTQKKTTPVENRLGTVEDVARIVAWLAQEESGWVSGQCLSASGGLEMY